MLQGGSHSGPRCHWPTFLMTQVKLALTDPRGTLLKLNNDEKLPRPPCALGQEKEVSKKRPTPPNYDQRING